jgi:hypothetical protein
MRLWALVVPPREIETTTNVPQQHDVENSRDVVALVNKLSKGIVWSYQSSPYEFMKPLQYLHFVGKPPITETGPRNEIAIPWEAVGGLVRDEELEKDLGNDAMFAMDLILQAQFVEKATKTSRADWENWVAIAAGTMIVLVTVYKDRPYTKLLMQHFQRHVYRARTQLQLTSLPERADKLVRKDYDDLKRYFMSYYVADPTPSPPTPYKPPVVVVPPPPPITIGTIDYPVMNGARPVVIIPGKGKRAFDFSDFQQRCIAGITGAGAEVVEPATVSWGFATLQETSPQQYSMALRTLRCSDPAHIGLFSVDAFIGERVSGPELMRWSEHTITFDDARAVHLLDGVGTPRGHLHGIANVTEASGYVGAAILPESEIRQLARRPRVVDELIVDVGDGSTSVSLVMVRMSKKQQEVPQFIIKLPPIDRHPMNIASSVAILTNIIDPRERILLLFEWITPTKLALRGLVTGSSSDIEPSISVQ